MDDECFFWASKISCSTIHSFTGKLVQVASADGIENPLRVTPEEAGSPYSHLAPVLLPTRSSIDSSGPTKLPDSETSFV